MGHLVPDDCFKQVLYYNVKKEKITSITITELNWLSFTDNFSWLPGKFSYPIQLCLHSFFSVLPSFWKWEILIHHTITLDCTSSGTKSTFPRAEHWKIPRSLHSGYTYIPVHYCYRSVFWPIIHVRKTLSYMHKH